MRMKPFCCRIPRCFKLSGKHVELPERLGSCEGVLILCQGAYILVGEEGNLMTVG